MDWKGRSDNVLGRVRRLRDSGGGAAVLARSRSAFWPGLWLVTVIILARVTGDHSAAVDQLEVCTRALYALDAADIMLTDKFE